MDSMEGHSEMGKILKAQNGTVVTINNKSNREMKLSKSVSPSGKAGNGYPDDISSGGSVQFNHVADGDYGSKGAVLYSGYNKGGDQCGWILAWYAPADNTSSGTPNKVYVICGALDQMKPKFDGILSDLETWKTTSTFTDSVNTNTKADAEIKDVNGTSKASLTMQLSHSSLKINYGDMFVLRRLPPACVFRIPT